MEGEAGCVPSHAWCSCPTSSPRAHQALLTAVTHSHSEWMDPTLAVPAPRGRRVRLEEPFPNPSRPSLGAALLIPAQECYMVNPRMLPSEPKVREGTCPVSHCGELLGAPLVTSQCSQQCQAASWLGGAHNWHLCSQKAPGSQCLVLGNPDYSITHSLAVTGSNSSSKLTPCWI